MWGLLTVVASASAVLSFAALRDLAILCSFHERLSFLLPLVVDAGAAAGCLVWLSPKDVTTEARRFARTLTFVLLASSVAGNAIVHGLSAYGLRPHWTLVVAVSGVAPAVLGAVVHLSVLVGRDDSGKTEAPGVGFEPTSRQSRGLLGEGAPTPCSPRTSENEAEPTPAPSRPKPKILPATPDNSGDLLARARELAPIGRRALSDALGVSVHRARKLLEELDAEQVPRNGVKVLEDAK
jgi:hypothetical protein